ncbi:MAG: hypothetical protein WC560_08265 [Syntrophales bacterium]
MHVAIIHDHVTDADAPDAVDVLVQADVVEKALAVLGHTSVHIGCTLDLEAVRRALTDSAADMVFNLVESIEGKDRLLHLFPFLLDAMGMAYTGARAESMLLTSNKVLAKKWMASCGIPTPSWTFGRNETTPDTREEETSRFDWIIKSVWEHASIGLDERSVVRGADTDQIEALISDRTPQPGRTYYAERYIEGREFNLSVLAGPHGPEVLPPAEITFEGFTNDMPRIVDYNAKWNASSYEYEHTRRRFDFDPADRPLVDSLCSISLRCWRCFDMCGYCRIDFRVDTAGTPWVLEINANPCLSPDAGFVAALSRANISYTEAVRRILNDTGNHLW